MARRVDTELREATGGDALPPAETDARDLIAAAKRKRGAEVVPPTTRRRKRRPAEDDPAYGDQVSPGGSALDGIPAGSTGLFSRTGIRAWTATAIIAVAAVLMLSLIAVGDLPQPLPVNNVTITWLPGPRVPDAEVVGWLKRCPQFEKLSTPNEWVLEKLADHLRALPAVAEVRRVRLFHEPGKIPAIRQQRGKPPVRVQVDGIRRTVEIQLALRQPYLPAVLRDGGRAWIDEDGLVLPGVLPGPGVPRPVVRGVEAGGRVALAAAVAVWKRLEPEVEKGLVASIGLADPLEDAAPPAQTLPAVVPPGTAPAAVLPAAPPMPRGIVLYTRQGSRLVWGRPGDERFGVDADGKARDLLHTLRCQGDLNRIASINVRFHEPVYTLR